VFDSVLCASNARAICMLSVSCGVYCQQLCSALQCSLHDRQGVELAESAATV
jgi:hypothetical protein